MNRAALTLLILAAALARSPAATAQGLDLSQGGAIDVTSRDGMEWRQNEQMVIARGDARAVRGTVTVTADVLIARYRKKAPVPGSAPPATPAATPVVAPGVAAPGVAAPGAAPPVPGSPTDTGANEIYRLEAEGHVRIFTATDLAVGDKAVYDIDQAVLLMTGSAMMITTPQQVMTARDTMEYWSQKHMAVGRGQAIVNTSDGRRLNGDTLVGFTNPDTPAPGAPAAARRPPPPPQPAAADGKPAAASLTSGKLQRVEAFGHVQLRTATETIVGDRGVYVADTGIARIAGDVRITRGQNQLDGDEALVNMKTGISTLVRDPGKRVQGLVVPNDASKDLAAHPLTPSPTPAAPARTR